MQAEASARGAELDAVLFCPHTPEDNAPAESLLPV